MVDYIVPKKDVLDLYRRHKSEFNFNLRSDDEFIIFLLDTASRVISIAHQLTPVIEAVSVESEPRIDFEDSESQDDMRDSKPDPISVPVSQEAPVCSPVQSPCKSEPPANQEDEISQLAKEIESVANTLLDEQNNTNFLNNGQLTDAVSVEFKSEESASELLADQNFMPTVTDTGDQTFKPSVTPAMGYSMLEMSTIKEDHNRSTTRSTTEQISKNAFSKGALSTKPSERLSAYSSVQDVFKIDPNGNHHELSKSKQRRCKICHKIRRKSCSICDVGLCQRECFLVFHEDFNNYNIYVEKYKCFGKNHRARINYLPYNYHRLVDQYGRNSSSFEGVAVPSNLSNSPAAANSTFSRENLPQVSTSQFGNQLNHTLASSTANTSDPTYISRCIKLETFDLEPQS